MDIQQATVGNVTLALLSDAPVKTYLFVISADPQTKGFRIMVRTDLAGIQIDIALDRPNQLGYRAYNLSGVLQHITVQELQTMNTAAFAAKDGKIG